MATQTTSPHGNGAAFSQATNRLQAQPEVRQLESPDFFHQFFANAPLGLCLLSHQGQFLAVNQTFAELIGMPHERLIGQTLDLFVPQGSALCGEWMQCLARREAPTPVEVECTTPHGLRIFSFQPFVSTPEAVPTGVTLLIRDITVERQQQRERDLVYQLAHDLARSLDMTSIANTVLSWAQKLLGVQYVDLMVADPGSTELRGVANTHDSHSFRQERIETSKELAIASHIFQRRQPVVLENFVESSLVSERLRQRYPHLRATWGVPMMSGETVVGVLCAAYFTPDTITEDKVRLLQLLGDEAALAVERARLTESLQEQTVELQRSNAELEQFAYAASHDVKEPLRGIHQYAQWLREEHAHSLEGAGIEKLDTIDRLSQRLETLIDTLLHYARVGRGELELTATDLNQLVGQVQEMLSVQFKETGAELRLPRPLPSIPCAPVLVTEVFSNLLSNALKYNSKEKKWVEIGFVAPGEQAPASVPWPSEAEDSAANVFYVRDNGIGIASTNFEKIFQIFRRLHGRDQFDGGTGAGLTITKKIIERHSGRIWVASTPGEGTTFCFTLSAE